ncbi:MAG: FAD-binding oxidoreductase [Thermomicrobiales bacterium]|nr:FAD-binding oxidoreductase [Thermomicrobiales bacterium]
MGSDVNASGNVPATADVVVIGGGVVGASTAFQLTRHGVRNVVLVERTHLAAGATGKSGALVRAHYANAPETQLTLESLKIFRNWDDIVGHGDPGLRAIGMLRIVHPDDEANLRANIETQQRLGGNTMVVTAEEMREIDPLLYTGDITVAGWEPDTGYADGPTTVYGFARAARANGAAILEGTEVLSIRTEGARITGVETNRGTISTSNVVLAAGGFANRLLLPLCIDLGMSPRRIQVAVFRWPFSMDHTRPHRVVIDSLHRSWMRPEGIAGTLIGVESRADDKIDPGAFDESVAPAYVDVARQALAARYPVFDGALMRGAWAGVVMQSPDDHPIIDKMSEYEGLFVSSGDSGSSFKTGPAVGIIFAEWITAGEPQLMDMTPFRSTRFAEGQPWVDATSYTNESMGSTVSR